MEKQIKSNIQVRRDTAANWSSSDRVLLTGELGYDTTNKRTKMGDGTTKWNDLTWLTDNASVTTALNGKANSVHNRDAHSDINQSLLTTNTVQFAKIGIGTATPNESLDVVGNARIRSEGSMKFGGVGATDAAFEIKYNSSTKSLDFNFLL